jgi:hypothetical protein
LWNRVYSDFNFLELTQSQAGELAEGNVGTMEKVPRSAKI